MKNRMITKWIFGPAMLAVMGMMTAGCANKPKHEVQMDTSELRPAETDQNEAAASNVSEPTAAAEPAADTAYKAAAAPAPLNSEAEKSRTSPRPIKRVEPATLTEAMNAPQKPAAPVGVKYYTVQRDDTFWSISRRVYGSGKYWKKIQDANPDVSPEKLFVGHKIVIPEIEK